LVVQRGSIEREHIERWREMERDGERERERERDIHYHVHAAFKIKKGLYGRRSCLWPEGYY
jgi:hypothetical protein